MKPPFAAIAYLALGLCACRKQESKDWRVGMVCIGTIPAEEGPASTALGESFKSQNVYYLLDGSIAWAIYVRSNDTAKARALLPDNTNLVVVTDRNGILQLRPR